jgi:hypothetical protein
VLPNQLSACLHEPFGESSFRRVVIDLPSRLLRLLPSPVHTRMCFSIRAWPDRSFREMKGSLQWGGHRLGRIV